METHGTTLRSTTANYRRVILFPLPFQGHITPMLQLANILHTHGRFKITVIHTEFNSPNPSNYPQFSFRPIKDGFSEIVHLLSSHSQDASFFLKFLNKSCVDPFRDCLAGLLAEPSDEKVACLITDAGFYFSQVIADDLKLPRLVLRTSSLGCILAYNVLPFHSKDGCFYPTKEDYEASVSEYPLLKVKDVVKITTNPEGMGEILANMITQMRASSGLICNSLKEPEEYEFETISREFLVSSFTLGPFHKYVLASSSSLIEQDRTILLWLNNQPRKSVLYVSFGSLAHLTESEFQEVAHEIENTNLPFLWVVRPGMIVGSEWLDSLPENYLERMSDKARIVKWSPQQEVLAHPVIGCFWTHNGWNSTLESICEGVPMICSPCFSDQPIIARYVSDIWKVGILLENGFERKVSRWHLNE